jgi:glycosyltransferase involved in cell wall biosynthesis
VSGPVRNVDGDLLPKQVGDSSARLVVTYDEDVPDNRTIDSNESAIHASVVPALAKVMSPAMVGLVPQQDAVVAENAAAQPSAQRALEGKIDKATWTIIEGWVWSPTIPKERIRLELVEGEAQLAMSVADNYRADLVLAGIGDGRHAFGIVLKPGLLSEERHVLNLRCADTGVVMPGSPIILEPPADTRHAAIVGAIDQITDMEATGWIFVRNEPSRRCVVVLKEGRSVLTRTMASRFRGDLLSGGIGDGCYAFTLEMPRVLLDGNAHLIEIVEESTGFTLTKEPVRWRSTVGTANAALTSISSEMRNAGADSVARHLDIQLERSPIGPRIDYDVIRPLPAPGKHSATFGKPSSLTDTCARPHLLFDVSDLVYYIGHHSNLTGIQRVQSSIIISMIDGEVAPQTVIFLSFDPRVGRWTTIPTGFLISLLRDLFRPESQRLVTFVAEEARCGALPGAQQFDGLGVLDDGNPSILYLLGAAWVQQDYVHRVLALKRRFGTRFALTVHDLIPIYARETCDQDTVRVFERFMRRALPHADLVLADSENTAKDVRRYLATLGLPEPALSVTKCGSSFAEFLPKDWHAAETTLRDLPERFVLFVATIEGRKNHQLIFDVWRRMLEESDDVPHLICVGRLGWKAEAFVSALVETNYLDGRVHLLREISDTDLFALYERSLFTVFPSVYEGWGLPVGESLAMGKICVSSNRASIPEVAGGCGVYIDIDNFDQSLEVIRNLIRNETARKDLEAKIRREYVPLTWHSVAEKVVATCEASANVEWQEPYPYTAVPYSTEISFGRLDQEPTAIGELLLARIVDARLGHFKSDVLGQQNFLLGEESRSGGVWAEPERWGTWLCHSGGDIVFGLAAEASQFYHIFVRLRICEWLQEQPIRLLANGEKLWEGKIALHSTDLMLRVRKKTSATSKWQLRIAAEVDLSPNLKAQIAAVDGRVPTIGFERLVIVPENDYKTRLDMLTNLLSSLLQGGSTLPDRQN